MWTVAEIKTDHSKVGTLVNNLAFAAPAISNTCFGVKLVPKPEVYGTHARNLDAKQSIVEIFHPELCACSDEHVRRVSKEYFSGSHALYKIVKIRSKA